MQLKPALTNPGLSRKAAALRTWEPAGPNSAQSVPERSTLEGSSPITDESKSETNKLAEVAVTALTTVAGAATGIYAGTRTGTLPCLVGMAAGAYIGCRTGVRLVLSGNHDGHTAGFAAAMVAASLGGLGLIGGAVGGGLLGGLAAGPTTGALLGALGAWNGYSTGRSLTS